VDQILPHHRHFLINPTSFRDIFFPFSARIARCNSIRPAEVNPLPYTKRELVPSSPPLSTIDGALRTSSTPLVCADARFTYHRTSSTRPQLVELLQQMPETLVLALLDLHRVIVSQYSTRVGN
jgi:hypothetical protein